MNSAEIIWETFKGHFSDNYDGDELSRFWEACNDAIIELNRLSDLENDLRDGSEQRKNIVLFNVEYTPVN